MKKYAIAPKDIWGYKKGHRFEILRFPRDTSFFILDENGDERFCLVRNCGHVMPLQWKIIEEETLEESVIELEIAP